MSKILEWFIYICITALILALAQALYRAPHKALELKKTRFFMPNDLFIHLILLVNYWVILVILLESGMMDENNRVITLITASLFAPFLNWWHKRRTGEI